MTQTIGAQLGLFAFAAALLAGLFAGNTAHVTVLRALAVMIAATLVGQLAGAAAKVVLREYLQRHKTQIDREHTASMAALAEDLPAVAPEAPDAGAETRTS